MAQKGKEKLKNFTQFVEQLFPHEVSYLVSVANFEDHDNKLIFQRIVENKHSESHIPFDTDIDKRKYSRIKKWINSKLGLLDVDLQYQWITHMESQIMKDEISPGEEKELLKSLSKPGLPYYFVKYYDLLKHFRQYLLIRMRHRAYEKVSEYLSSKQSTYEKSLSTYEKIHQATIDITNQYSLNNTESEQWEQLLKGYFYDEELDGLNRFLSAVRLNFLYLNYREYQKLGRILDGQDKIFSKGICYSRRILSNYYSNRLLFHSLIGELDTAIEYGYLSIQTKNSDYLHYVNSLSSVLLRAGKTTEALKLMKEALPELRHSPNTHTRVVFATYYIRCLKENKLCKEAQRYAEIFLRGYSDQVMSQRWHSFFTAYLQTLLQQEDYDQIVKLSNKYKLLKKEETYKKRPGYIPTLDWYIRMAQYKEGIISNEQLQRHMIEKGRRAFLSSEKTRYAIQELITEIYPHLPASMEKIKQQVCS
ncbi:MAG: hypothetical protein MRZ79_07275 [Bacteroidia bacterium]|nr:hypothetical protein [Bacteroidia bacterium]